MNTRMQRTDESRRPHLARTIVAQIILFVLSGFIADRIFGVAVVIGIALYWIVYAVLMSRSTGTLGRGGRLWIMWGFAVSFAAGFLIGYPLVSVLDR